MIVAFRRHTLLALDDCLHALQPTIPHLTRSSLHRCIAADVRKFCARIAVTEADAAGFAVCVPARTAWPAAATNLPLPDS